MVTFYPFVDHAVPDVSGLSACEQFPRPAPPVKINGVLLVGDMTSEQLHLASEEDMKEVEDDINKLAKVAWTGSYNDLNDKPPPSPGSEVVPPSTDPSAAGKAADAKATGDALYTGFTEWVVSGAPSEGYELLGIEYKTTTPAGEPRWCVKFKDETASTPRTVVLVSDQTDLAATELTFSTLTPSSAFYGMTATRHLVTPTKTSQLTNDGDGTSDFATVSQLPAVPSAYASTPAMDGTGSAGSATTWSRGDHVHPSDTSKLNGDAAYPAWEDVPYEYGDIVSHGGRIWTAVASPTSEEPSEESDEWEQTRIEVLLDAKQDALSSAQLANIAAVPNKANSSDLPYALVVPGEWSFMGLSGEETGTPSMTYDNGGWTIYLPYDGETDSETAQGSENDLVVVFSERGITATRASLPGHLLDRAVNAVSVSSATTLTMPAVTAGKVRDLMVRIDVTGTQSITFGVPSGESQISWLGANPPQSFAAGVHLISISESAQGEFVFVDAMLADPESAANKVTSLSALSTDVQYPSAKCVYDLVGDVESVLAAINGGVAS